MTGMLCGHSRKPTWTRLYTNRTRVPDEWSHPRKNRGTWNSKHQTKQTQSRSYSQRCICRVLGTDFHPQAVGIGMPQIPISDGTHLATSMDTIHALSKAWKREVPTQRINPEDEEAMNQKKHQVELKMQVHSLTHQLREMKRENAAKTNPQAWEALQKQLQDLTLQHGYVKLPLNGSILVSKNDLLLESAAAIPKWRWHPTQTTQCRCQVYRACMSLWHFPIHNAVVCDIY